MSYENTQCPCGGKKLIDTMLCSECEAFLADHPSMKVRLDARHHAAQWKGLSRSAEEGR